MCYICRQACRARTQLKLWSPTSLCCEAARGGFCCLLPALPHEITARQRHSQMAFVSFQVRTHSRSHFQIAPAQTPFTGRFAANHCHDYMHQMDPGGLISAEISSLHLYTHAQLLCVWFGDSYGPVVSVQL